MRASAGEVTIVWDPCDGDGSIGLMVSLKNGPAVRVGLSDSEARCVLRALHNAVNETSL